MFIPRAPSLCLHAAPCGSQIKRALSILHIQTEDAFFLVDIEVSCLTGLQKAHRVGSGLVGFISVLLLGSNFFWVEQYLFYDWVLQLCEW